MLLAVKHQRQHEGNQWYKQQQQQQQKRPEEKLTALYPPC
jgi:hypothetical protein